MYTAYFDSGTTNTRLYLLDESFQIVFSEKGGFGSKDSAIAGSNSGLLASMKSLYNKGIRSCGVRDVDIDAIYASGMLTSPYGILEVPHVAVPVSIEEFSGSLQYYFEDQYFHRKIGLIPGLKTADPDFTFINNMRGEEIEIIGALDDLAAQTEQAVVLLPGSHTHAAYMEAGVIKGLLSNFTGELFYALKTSTILSPVLSAEQETLDKEMIKKGYACLDQFGFNRAIYLAHAMQIFRQGSAAQRFSFGEGVINGGIRQSVEYYCRNMWNGCQTAALLGNRFMYELYSCIFEESSVIRQILWLPDLKEKPYSVKGLEKIVRMRGKENEV